MARTSFFHLAVVCAVGLVSASTAAAQLKVGIVNLQKAIIDTAEIKKDQADMEAKYKPRQDALQQLQKELSLLQAQLQSGKLTQDAGLQVQTEGQQKQRDLQRMQDDLQTDVNNDRQEILQRVGKRMTDVIKKIAEEKGLDVVMDVTNTVFFKPALEITTEATSSYDKTYPLK
ncbi:MAG: OmpH family outer membrane protein [Bryobacteraceae bacterium]